MESATGAEPVLPTTETDDAAASTPSKLTEAQWRAMRSVLDALLSYRDEEGHDPSKIFHKRVNRRFVPDYYDVIKEPMAFSNLKQKIADREYQSFVDFVRDNALIWHNAHTYNRPDAGAYQDAVLLKDLMEEEFQKLVKEKIVSAEEVEWPDLGEIPPVEDIPEEDDDEEEEEEEEEEEADDSEDEVPKKRGPGRPRRRDTLVSEKGDTGKKKRGRPPKVDTPNESRIKNVLKGLRKLKNDDGLLIFNFEKLPERTAMPEYYATIKRPMSLDQIKKSLKRKRYRTVDDCLRDVDVMFENAKIYNEDDSQIHLDAIELQAEAHRLAAIEKAKPDTDFGLDEGRKPRPAGIEHNGELWKVGDWVHINNANDATKPIIAQLYRTWEDSEGQEWVNACWYYRPEQTVHHYERHFYPMEVVKTGQYRDHPIDDIIEKCFVMFYTRYPKGRPRDIPSNAKVYVCEARYNEEKHKINKIKTWASCVPDEIRDQDYEMDFYPEGPRRIRRMPSPLLYMLEQGDVTEKVPQPKWGEENAPPIVGGIFKGARDENQSPPPEATPTPVPEATPQPRQAPPVTVDDPWGKADAHFKKITETFSESPASRPENTSQAHSYTPQPQHYKAPQAHATQPHGQTYAPVQTAYATPIPQHGMPGGTPGYDQYGTPARASFSSHAPVSAPQPRYSQTQVPMMPGGRLADTFVLNDHQNAQIPEEVRNQFHQDEAGRVLFFLKPPLAKLPSERPAKLGGHTIKFRAAKLRRELKLRAKLDKEAVVPVSDNRSHSPKRRRIGNNQVNGFHEHSQELVSQPQPVDSEALFMKLTDQPLSKWLEDMEVGTATILHAMQPGTKVVHLQLANRAQLKSMQAELNEEEDAVAEDWRERDEVERSNRDIWKEPKVYLDDVDPRLL